MIRIALLLLALCPAGLAAQAAATGSLEGTVHDSIRGRPLAGARVLLGGTAAQSTRTDAAGAFRFDALPPGEYQVSVLDPLLDLLDAAPWASDLHLAAGERMTVALASPSIGEARRLLCEEPGNVLIYGFVRRAGTLEPLPGQDVELRWSHPHGNTEAWQVLPANADGGYVSCLVDPNTDVVVRPFKMLNVRPHFFRSRHGETRNLDVILP